MLAAIDAVDEAAKPALQLGLADADDRLRRMRSQRRKRSTDALARRDRVSECEARCYESYHFSIPQIVVSMNEIYGITTPGELCIAFSKQRVEPLMDSVHFDEVLAILRSQPQ